MSEKYSIEEFISKTYPSHTHNEHRKRFVTINSLYKNIFGGEAGCFISSPGRIEIAGNHTDHNNGKVMTAAIDLDTLLFGEKNNSSEICIYSDLYGKKTCINTHELEFLEDEKGSFKSLIKGIVWRFNNLGYKIDGFNAVLSSNVFVGSGLSSSASIEMAICAMMNYLFNKNSIENTTLAKIGQYAENHFYGKPSGLMDQMACIHGAVSYIDFFDTREPALKSIPFGFDQFDMDIIIVDSGDDHSDLTDEYASIPGEMLKIASENGHKNLSEGSLKELIKHIPQLREKVNDRAVLRALHFYEENRRVEEMYLEMKNKNISKTLGYINESGRSSVQYLQNVFTCKKSLNQGMTLALAMSDIFPKNGTESAFRVHGGGFAGTIIAFIHKSIADDYISFMSLVFSKDKIKKLQIRQDGACILF